MSDSIIKIEGLGKKYIISHEKAESYTALRDVISRNAKKLVKRKEPLPAKEEFWALKDVSFDVKRGEAIGIIGKNGAGKSTLLKILSRITEPTHGRIEINGRVASLLEVGTGFHHELTGRENIFLNGAILGMSRAEIRKKFDEIVDFSGVEKFLDTPVKRYSSGMYVRLAFAVAAHLEPEILVVDEVLAVGDAEFQKKCLGKMGEVSKEEGRTVLFVSHNMLAVKSLCNKGVLLKNGMLEDAGEMEYVINKYVSHNFLSSFKEINLTKDHFTIQSIQVSNNGTEGNFDIDKDLEIVIKAKSDKQFEKININLFFNTVEGSLIFATCSEAERFDIGEYRYKCTIPANTLNDNIYNIDIMIVENAERPFINLKEIISIEGIESKREGSWLDKFPGLIRPLNYKWEKIFLQSDYIL